MSHRLKPEFFLEERVDREQVEVVALDFDDISALGRVDDGGDLGTVCLKLLGLLNNIWETGKDEFIEVLITAVDNPLEHSHMQVW